MVEWKVPFVNYKLQYRDMGEEIIAEIRRVLANGDLILRDDVERFEENFAKFVGAEYAIGVNSCTDAMRLSLKVAGIGKGDEVITASHTFLATLDAIVDVGAKPVLVDSGLDYNMDTSKLDDAVTPKTKAIMPVHLNGRMCNMDVVMSIAHRHALFVISDAAQAVGASFRGKKVGTFGIASCFSFYPAKILGTAGDGGMVVTNDRVFADKVRAMRDYGRVKGQEQVMGYGYNSRLDNLHAAILNLKLKMLPQWIDRRRIIAWRYNRWLKRLPTLCLPPPPDYGSDDGLVLPGNYYDVFQNYVIRAEKRDALIEYLTGNGVECLVSWRTPLHKQKALGFGKLKLPETEAISREVVSLPMYPELGCDQVEYVCDMIRGFYKQEETAYPPCLSESV